MLLERIDSLIPRWMLTAPRQAFGVLMASLAGLLDGMIEGVYQGRLAAMPGQVDLPGVPGLGGFDSVDALPLIARDRLVFPGLTELPWDLAGRCRRYADDWALSSGAFGLLSQVAAVLTPNVPLLRFVTTGGVWYTLELDGTLRLQNPAGTGFYLSPDGSSGVDATAAQAWDWDSTTEPPPVDQGDGSRGFLIAYNPVSIPYLTSTDGLENEPGIAGDAWDDPTAQVVGQPTEGTCGTNAPTMLVELIRGVLDQRRSMGFKVAWIIIAFDADSFNPDGSSTGLPTPYPDGAWGWHTTYDAGSNTRVVARLTTAEYWRGRPGGEP